MRDSFRCLSMQDDLVPWPASKLYIRLEINRRSSCESAWRVRILCQSLVYVSGMGKARL